MDNMSFLSVQFPNLISLSSVAIYGLALVPILITLQIVFPVPCAVQSQWEGHNGMADDTTGMEKTSVSMVVKTRKKWCSRVMD